MARVRRCPTFAGLVGRRWKFAITGSVSGWTNCGSVATRSRAPAPVKVPLNAMLQSKVFVVALCRVSIGSPLRATSTLSTTSTSPESITVTSPLEIAGERPLKYTVLLTMST